MTKDYHVYGLGNALVDIEIEISDEELERLQVGKGLMTLIDANRHHELLTHVHGQAHSRACGGSAANSTIAVAQLGGKSFYSCRIGNDETGDFYLMDLHREGVNSNLDQVAREEGVTGKCLVMITPDAERSMNTYLGITTDMNPSCLDLDALARSEYLYIEGYLASSESAVETARIAIKHAQENGVKVAVSLSDLSMIEFCREGLDNILFTKIDMLFANEQEACAYTGTNDLDTAQERLGAIAHSYAVTLGDKGAIIYDGDNKCSVDAHTVRAIDTNGAGDLFAGSYLYGISHGFSAKQAGMIASFASGLLVTKFGPRLNEEFITKVKDYGESIR